MTQAEGVYNQRLQNLAVTLDKVILPPLLLWFFFFFYFYFFYEDLRLEFCCKRKMAKANFLVRIVAHKN